MGLNPCLASFLLCLCSSHGHKGSRWQGGGEEPRQRQGERAQLVTGPQETCVSFPSIRGGGKDDHNVKLGNELGALRWLLGVPGKLLSSKDRPRQKTPKGKNGVNRRDVEETRRMLARREAPLLGNCAQSWGKSPPSHSRRRAADSPWLETSLDSPFSLLLRF